jgi:hypothetical protein
MGEVDGLSNTVPIVKMDIRLVMINIYILCPNSKGQQKKQQPIKFHDACLS